MRAAVVVPTRDRPVALARCLDALAAQDLGAVPLVGDLAILVVDDASADPDAVRAVAAGRARVVAGEGRGPAAARNLGARAAGAAGADAVLFTDDDCRPEQGWVAAHLARIERGAAVVAGPTLAGPGAAAPARAAQVVTNLLVAAPPGAGTVAFAPTSNLAGRADVFAALPFDERYPSAAGEDRDWCDRYTSTGGTIAFEPTAVVDHHPDLSLRRYWRQQVRYGRGAHRYRAAGDRPRPPIGFYLDLLRAGFRGGPSVGLLVALAQVATVVGVVAEARAGDGRDRAAR
ncbi:MAG: glycosyltransferase family 2 protein [Acidimicrobiia bacterium]